MAGHRPFWTGSRQARGLGEAAPLAGGTLRREPDSALVLRVQANLAPSLFYGIAMTKRRLQPRVVELTEKRRGVMAVRALVAPEYLYLSQEDGDIVKLQRGSYEEV